MSMFSNNLFSGLHMQPPTALLLTGFVTILALMTFTGCVAARFAAPKSRLAHALQQLNQRLQSMWSIIVVFSIALLTGGLGSILVFAGCSFLLFREFITITPTRRADQRALFWAFFVILPLQYVILGVNWYGLFIVFIPVYAFLFLPIRIAVQSDSEKFLERAAKIQWALMICVYCVSHAPALIKLTIPTSEGAGARLLLFLCIIVEANGVARQFVNTLWGCHVTSPKAGTPLAAEGVFAGIAASAGLGAVMSSVTPLTIIQAIFMAVLIGLLGSAGQLCLSIIRAERGCEGVVIVHRQNDMLGRTISLCFAAPVFFHMVRLFCMDNKLLLF